MVRMNIDRDEYGRNELLYDSELLGHLMDKYGDPINIKEMVKTPAFVYEIRTAAEYWFGGQNDHRTNDAIWRRCEAVDDGQWQLVGDELKYAEDVNL